MARYLNEPQLKTNLRLGKSVEQWLSTSKTEDYTIIKWLAIEKEKNQSYSVAYIESFDDGNEDFFDIYEFSTVNPDEASGVINTFDSVGEALNFSILNYHASINKFVATGMIQEEYRDYLRSK